jgi:hypothetical protein
MTGRHANQSTRFVTGPVSGPARYTETHASAANRYGSDAVRALDRKTSCL